MLSFSDRIRDLLHGFIYLTELETRVINHPLFQRLRHVRQNDVAFLVYPSMNTTRFEHSIGTLHVAGRMAVNITQSGAWDDYQQQLGCSPDHFIQICRLYALLHDVGHLPLSHLFEIAFEDYARDNLDSSQLATVFADWFGGEGFTKLHEAAGAVFAQQILSDVGVPEDLGDPVRELMGKKFLPSGNLLLPIKRLVDSEIDADRIDSTARDGLLAGGEYGTHDIERLASSVFLSRSETGWRLSYSHKALSSLEALLLDRYRTHRWIHFHHRVIALKCAARILIARLLTTGRISRDDFHGEETSIGLRDDVWLLAHIRDEQLPTDEGWSAARKLLLYRDKAVSCSLWKRRHEYHELQDRLCKRAQVRPPVDSVRFSRPYERWITERLGTQALVFQVPFSPLGSRAVPISSDNGSSQVGELTELSPVVSSLRSVWMKEPQYHVTFYGTKTDMRDGWLTHTAEWLSHGPS